jgi:phage baseplate assembly protein W
MAKILYKGFSTVGRNKKFRATDLDLVKQDLINHFSIRKGEKVMQPNFGSVIWNMLFEPMTEHLQQVIIDDVKKIVGYDPRVGLQNITITEQEYGMQIEVDLLFIPTNKSSQLSLQFNANSSKLTTNGTY